MTGLFVVLGVCLMGVEYTHAASHIELRDNFETASLDLKRWSLRRMTQKRHWIDANVYRDGKGALAIRVQGNDLDLECQCQQNEVREAADRRLKFGEDAWYAFSFMIRGKAAPAGKQRWVIGGWKQETNGSAFMAQRYDHGVFHITLESGDRRVLLASARQDAKGFLDLLKSGSQEGFGFVGDTKRYQGASDLKIEYGADPVLPDPGADWVDMMYRVRGGLAGDGLVEVFANGKLVVRATGTVGVPQVGGPTQYFKMGHNRAPMPGAATLYLDNFRRGATRDAVEFRVVQ